MFVEAFQDIMPKRRAKCIIAHYIPRLIVGHRCRLAGIANDENRFISRAVDKILGFCERAANGNIGQQPGYGDRIIGSGPDIENKKIAQIVIRILGRLMPIGKYCRKDRATRAAEKFVRILAIFSANRPGGIGAAEFILLATCPISSLLQMPSAMQFTKSNSIKNRYDFLVHGSLHFF